MTESRPTLPPHEFLKLNVSIPISLSCIEKKQPQTVHIGAQGPCSIATEHPEDINSHHIGFSLCLVVIISSLIQFPFLVIEGRSLLLLYNADKSAACRPRKCNLSRVSLALAYLMVANDDVEGQWRCSFLRSLCLPLPTPDAEFINRLQLALSIAVPVELLKENYGPLRSRERLY